jgi:hypothetical protein
VSDALGYCLDDGQLEIEGETAGYIALKCPAWALLDTTVLEQYGDRAGQDRRLPRGTIRAFRRRITSRQESMPFVIVGAVTEAGDPNLDPHIGFEENYGFLRDELVVDPGTVDGTRQARYTTPSGAVRTGRVHVLAIPLGEGSAGRYFATVELNIVDGMLT